MARRGESDSDRLARLRDFLAGAEALAERGLTEGEKRTAKRRVRELRGKIRRLQKKLSDAEPDVDVTVTGGGYMVSPQSTAAREWVDTNVEVPDWSWMGGSFPVGHRYIEDLVEGMQDAGLRVIFE